MDAVLDFVTNALWLAAIAVVLVVGAIYYKIRYKTASADEALVITGGKKPPKIMPGGGAFVPPNRKHEFFPLGVMTVSSSDQETQTKTLVPIVVRWTAQLRADVETDNALEKAVRGFGSYESKDIENSLQRTLDGEVRAVVATLTPEGVVTDKADFARKVTEGVNPRTEELGFKLVSLNIAEVSDRNNYFHNLAAEDREQRRQTAETLTAQANQRVAVDQAAASRVSKQAELDRDLAAREGQLVVDLRTAEIQIETDTANANAEIAGDLQREVRNKELATRRGEVAVITAQQDQEAAEAQRAAELTRAETAKQKRKIDAEAQAEQDEIDAQAAAAVAKASATGEAEASKERARGEAEAVKLTTDADANRIRVAGEAEAAATKAKGEAEAASILAKGEAEAEVQRKMAEALAANDGANLRVTLAEIQRDTTIKVSTTVGEAMARIGENATFIDMGGSGNGGGDLLSGVLGNIPELLAKLNVKSNALNGGDFGDVLGSTVAAALGKSTTDSPVTAASEAISLDELSDETVIDTENDAEPLDNVVSDSSPEQTDDTEIEA